MDNIVVLTTKGFYWLTKNRLYKESTKITQTYITLQKHVTCVTNNVYKNERVPSFFMEYETNQSVILCFKTRMTNSELHTQ